MVFKNGKASEKAKELKIGKVYSFQLKHFSNVFKHLNLDIFDGGCLGKKFKGETSVNLKIVSAESGVDSCNISEEMLLALSCELRRYDGIFFASKVVAKNNEEANDKYPVIYSANNFKKNGDKNNNIPIIGFTYMTKEALLRKKAISFIKDNSHGKV